MIQQTLNEINQMSVKIQQGVQKVLMQAGKAAFLSPQTHHNSSNQIKHRRTGHQRSNSEHIPTENSQSNIRKFLMEEQNNLLHQQLEQQKQKAKQYREQIKQMKKYIKFLQQYNDNLKKQVVLWMTRPAKKEGLFEFSNVDRRIKQYRMKLGQAINNSYQFQKIQSTNPNTININPQLELNPEVNLTKNPVKLRKNNVKGQPSLELYKKKGRFVESSQGFSGQQNQQQIYKNNKKLIQSQIFKKKNEQNSKKKYSLNQQRHYKQPECTSCNYIKFKNNRSSNYNTIQQKQGYIKSKKVNRDKLKIQRKNKNEKKVHNRSQCHHGYSQKKDINDLNISLDLKTYRNQNLCACHQKFMRSRKF